MNNIEVIGTTQVLKDAGVKPGQAEAIAKVVVARRDDLATKSDVSSLRTELKSDIAELKSGMAVVKSDIAELKSGMAVVKSDIAELKSDMTVVKSDIAELKSDMTVVKSDIAELKSDIAELKSDIVSHRNLFEDKINNLRWTMVVVGGVVVALVKFLP